jgi:hypothetical protein
MVCCCDAIALFELLDAVSYCSHLPAYFMSQDEWSPVKAVPLHNIAAADATGFNTNKQFTWSNRWNRPFLYSYISVAVPDCCSDSMISLIQNGYYFLFFVAFFDFSLSSIS